MNEHESNDNDETITHRIERIQQIDPDELAREPEWKKWLRAACNRTYGDDLPYGAITVPNANKYLVTINAVCEVCQPNEDDHTFSIFITKQGSKKKCKDNEPKRWDSTILNHFKDAERKKLFNGKVNLGIKEDNAGDEEETDTLKLALQIIIKLLKKEKIRRFYDEEKKTEYIYKQITEERVIHGQRKQIKIPRWEPIEHPAVPGKLKTTYNYLCDIIYRREGEPEELADYVLLYDYVMAHNHYVSFMKSLVQMIADLPPETFPYYNKDPFLWAFRNGIWYSHTDATRRDCAFFIDDDSGEYPDGENLMACRYYAEENIPLECNDIHDPDGIEILCDDQWHKKVMEVQTFFMEMKRTCDYTRFIFAGNSKHIKKCPTNCKKEHEHTQDCQINCKQEHQHIQIGCPTNCKEFHDIPQHIKGCEAKCQLPHVHQNGCNTNCDHIHHRTWYEHDQTCKNIQTDFADKSSTRQKELIIQWDKIMRGRCAFPINFLDDWKVGLMYDGASSSAKTPYVETVVNWFDVEDTARMQSDPNDTINRYLLADAADKRLLAMVEGKGDPPFAQSVWQQLMDGSLTAFRGIYQKGKKCRWGTSWISATQYPFAYNDDSKSYAKRTVRFTMDISVKEADRIADLATKMKRETGIHMIKCVKYYHWKLRQLGNRSDDLYSRKVDNITLEYTTLPQYFFDQQDRLVSDAHIFDEFIYHQIQEGIYETGANYRVPDSIIRDDFAKWIDAKFKKNTPKYQWGTAFHQGTRERFGGIEVSKTSGVFWDYEWKGCLIWKGLRTTSTFKPKRTDKQSSFTNNTNNK